MRAVFIKVPSNLAQYNFLQLLPECHIQIHSETGQNKRKTKYHNIKFLISSDSMIGWELQFRFL